MKLYYSGNKITKAHDTDLGFDLPIAEDVIIPPNKTMVVRTGIRMVFPEGVGGLIKDRSSMAKRGIFVHGGVIDPDYTGEIRVVLFNSNSNPIKLKRGERIAQLLLFPLMKVEVVEVDNIEDFATNKLRGEKGFGSSGK